MSKKFRLQAILLILLMAAFSIYAFPLVYFNDGACAFEPGCDPGGEGDGSGLYVPLSSGLMSMYIVEGAGYVLDARAGVSTFMNRFETAELTGADFPEMRSILYGVIDNLERAKCYYMYIDYIAAFTPYRESVIERLKAFDYESFQKNGGLYSKVFDRVKERLSRGDVRGVFSSISKDIDLLLYRLYALKASIDTEKFPSVLSVWQLNQAFSENLFFGQYFAMVMYEVK